MHCTSFKNLDFVEKQFVLIVAQQNFFHEILSSQFFFDRQYS